MGKVPEQVRSRWQGAAGGGVAALAIAFAVYRFASGGAEPISPDQQKALDRERQLQAAAAEVPAPADPTPPPVITQPSRGAVAAP